jgi:putative PIN family toxin of toxin-antitoxin system
LISAVLDANVILSGIVGFFRVESTTGEVMRRWQADQFILASSPAIVSEVEEGLAEPYFRARLEKSLVETTLLELRDAAGRVELSGSVRGVASHSEDDPVLETALVARADYLVTGDRPLQRIGQIEDVVIVSPIEFLRILDRESTH